MLIILVVVYVANLGPPQRQLAFNSSYVCDSPEASMHTCNIAELCTAHFPQYQLHYIFLGCCEAGHRRKRTEEYQFPTELCVGVKSSEHFHQYHEYLVMNPAISPSF